MLQTGFQIKVPALSSMLKPCLPLPHDYREGGGGTEYE